MSSLLLNYQKQYNNHQHNQHYINSNRLRLFFSLLQLLLQSCCQSLCIRKLLAQFRILCSYLCQRFLQDCIPLLNPSYVLVETLRFFLTPFDTTPETCTSVSSYHG